MIPARQQPSSTHRPSSRSNHRQFVVPGTLAETEFLFGHACGNRPAGGNVVLSRDRSRPARPMRTTAKSMYLLGVGFVVAPAKWMASEHSKSQSRNLLHDVAHARDSGLQLGVGVAPHRRRNHGALSRLRPISAGQEHCVKRVCLNEESHTTGVVACLVGQEGGRAPSGA